MAKQRIDWLDYLRAMACVMVVVIHLVSHTRYQNEAESTAFLVGTVLDALARVGIPLFFMISGYFLLDAGYRSLHRPMLDLPLTFAGVFGLSLVCSMMIRKVDRGHWVS